MEDENKIRQKIRFLLSLAERSDEKKRRQALAMLDKLVTDNYPPVKGVPLPSDSLERSYNCYVCYTRGRDYEL